MSFADIPFSGVDSSGNGTVNLSVNRSKMVDSSVSEEKTRQLQDSGVWLTVRETVNLLGVSKQAFHKSKPDEKYATKMTTGRGGKRMMILLSSLPEFAQVEYWKAHHEQKQMTGIELARRDEEFMRRGEIADWNKEVALLRHRVLKAYLRFVAEAPPKMTMAYKRRFCELFNEGVFEELQDCRVRVKKVSYQTLDNWKKALDEAEGDTFALATRFGRSKGKTMVSDAEAKLLRRFALLPNKMTVAEVINLVKRELNLLGVPVSASDSTLRRWLSEFRCENYHLWTMARDGVKALNDNCLPYIVRSIEEIEVGDILVADGHTFNFDILNPLTGRPVRMTLVLVFDMRSSMPVGWEIAESENTQAIAMAMFRAIRAIGFVPRVFYLDNGKAFRGRFFTKVNNFSSSELPGLFERLKPFGYLDTMFAWAYHGQSKTVERFFGVLSQFERQVSSYRGNSIENKVARLHRNEKLHALLYDRFTGGSTPHATDIHGALIEWFEEYAHTPKGRMSGLKGRKPIDVFNESRERVRSAEGFADRRIEDGKLRFLMMAAEQRAVYRNGIKLFGRHYWHDSLYGYEFGQKRFVVRYDLMDVSRVYVFDESGENLLCEAAAGEFENVHPAARLLGSDEDKERLSGVIGRKQGFKQATVHMAKEFFRAEELLDGKALPPVKKPKQVAEKSGTDDVPEDLRIENIELPEPKRDDDLERYDINRMWEE